jgi:hypothetical protein
MYDINEMLETLRTVVDPYVTVSFSQQDKTDALRLNTEVIHEICSYYVYDRRHELVIYVYDRQPCAGKSQVHMVRSVTRYS